MRKIANNKGQTLLFVVVALTIAIVVMMGVASRLMTILSNTSDTDTSSKSVSAAEAGAERFLILSDAELVNALSSNGAAITCPDSAAVYENGTWGCTFDLPEDAEHQIKTRAFVTVRDYIFRNNEDHVKFSLNKGGFHEVNIRGYSSSQIDLCWNGDTYIQYSSYNRVGQILKGGVKCNSCSVQSDDFSGFEIADLGSHAEYSNCKRIEVIPGNPAIKTGLRVRAVSGSASVGIFPISNDLPSQGFEITSVGTLKSVVTNESITRTVKVYKSRSYPSSIFDFVLFSNSGILE